LIAAYIILSVYIFLMIVICTFCIIEFGLAIQFYKFKKGRILLFNQHKKREEKELPFVTIQLPIYNEKYVIERLVLACVEMDYPKEKFEIQILDDSTDETVNIVKKIVAQLKTKGLQITHIQREDRTGFKAGALQYGLQTSKGEFIAIFDADFVPPNDFIKRTIAAFDNDNIGMVQTRWEHINEDYSLLTQLQAFTLDLHFSIEHIGRNSNGYFINFNGTAGMWRKQAIVDAGGWSADTITEDLDLSYRAQLKNWQFKYLFDVGSPAELPVELNGFKSQQFRWNKGGAEVALKLIPSILKSKMPFKLKMHGIHHLLSSSMYLLIFLSALLSVPVLFFKNYYPPQIINASAIFLIGFIAIGFVYFLSYKNSEKNKYKSDLNFLLRLLTFMAFSIGMSLHNSISIVEALFRKKSPFIRTAKFNIQSKADNWKNRNYIINRISLLVCFEISMLFYFGAALVYAFMFNEFGLFLFHLMAFTGFAILNYYTFKQNLFRK